RAGDREALAEGLRLHAVDLLEAGRVAEAAAERARAEEAIIALRRPLYLWYPAMWRAMEARRTGDPDAAACIEAFRQEGARWQYRDADLVHAAQALHLAVERGDAAEVLAVVGSVEASLGERAARLVHVTTWARAGAGELDAAA